MTPPLPHEIKARIVTLIADSRLDADEAENDEQADELTRSVRRDLLACCSISRGWLAATQPILYASPLELLYHDGPSQVKPLYKTLEARPALGQLVQTLAFVTGPSRDAQDWPLMHVDLLPNLKHVSGLHWPLPPKISYPPASLRPALTSLSLFSSALSIPLAQRTSPALWFNLESLERLDIDQNHTGIIDSVLPALPVDLRHVSVRGTDLTLEEAADLLESLAPCRKLESLVLLPEYSTSKGFFDGPNPLELFPALRYLHFAHDAPAFLFGAGHAALETLILRKPAVAVPELMRVFAVHALREGIHDGLQEGLNAGLMSLFTSVAELCEAIAEDRGRYPSLRTVGVWTARYGQMLVWQKMKKDGTRRDAVVLARMVRRVGLQLIDAFGEAWQDAWFDEEV